MKEDKHETLERILDKLTEYVTFEIEGNQDIFQIVQDLFRKDGQV